MLTHYLAIVWTQRGVSDGVHPAVQEWTTNSSIERLRTLLASVDLDQLTPTVEPMVMNVERGRTWTALFNAEVEEMNDREPSASVTTPAAPETSTLSPPAAMGSTATATEEEPMEVVVEKKDEASAIVHGQPRQRSRLEKLRQEVAEARQKEANRVKTPEPVIDVVVGSQTWHNEVPRVRLVFIVFFVCSVFNREMFWYFLRNGFQLSRVISNAKVEHRHLCR